MSKFFQATEDNAKPIAIPQLFPENSPANKAMLLNGVIREDLLPACIISGLKFLNASCQKVVLSTILVE